MSPNWPVEERWREVEGSGMVWGVVEQLPYLGKQGGHLRHRHADLLRAGQEADGEKKKKRRGGGEAGEMAAIR